MLFPESRPLEHSESIQMENFSSSIQSNDEHPPVVIRPRRKAYAIGIGLLLVVVFLWTSSNFVTQVCCYVY
jgi:hypothetical protein